MDSEDQVQPKPRRNLLKLALIGLTLGSVAAGAMFSVVAMTTCWYPAHRPNHNGRRLASAVEMYLSEHQRCPDINDLLSARILSSKSDYRDAWHRDFKITCDERGASVVSSGPDGRFDTEDDVE